MSKRRSDRATLKSERSGWPYWSPGDWELFAIPLSGSEEEIIRVEALVEAALIHLEAATEADTTAIYQVAHTAELLMTLQGADGLWPAILNARTGNAVGSARAFAPVTLFRRLDALQDTDLFGSVCEAAEAGFSRLNSV